MSCSVFLRSRYCHICLFPPLLSGPSVFVASSCILNFCINDKMFILFISISDTDPEKWDQIVTDKHIDRLSPLIGNHSLVFMVELGMDFQTWTQINHKQAERDLVKLNRDILLEWRFKFCALHGIRPSLRHIGEAFSNTGKDIRLVTNLLFD